MSSVSFTRRSQFSPASSTSFRPPGQPSAPPPTRQPTYSSLGEALGSERPGLSPYTHQQPPPPPTAPMPMSSDGRYMYQHQQGMTSYDYSSYPPHNSYDASQYPQNHSRQPRSSQSHPSSEHVPYNPPHPHYHAPYGSTPYAVPHSAPPQWNGEAWTQFSQPVAPAPAPSVPDPPAPPPVNRPEPAPAPPAPAPAPAPAPTPATPSQRVYAPSPQPQPNTELRRGAGTPKAAEPPPPQQKRKPREKEVAAPRHPSPLASTPLDIDFGKACSLNVRFSIDSFTDVDDLFRLCLRIYETLQLGESYRIIIDTTKALSSDPATVQGRPPSLEALQRISQSAALGLRLLGSTVGADPPGAAPSAEPPVANPGSAEDGDAAAKRQARPNCSPP